MSGILDTTLVGVGVFHARLTTGNSCVVLLSGCSVSKAASTGPRP
jgi:hypothetical protein